MSKIDAQTVIDWFKNEKDNLYDLELGYLSVGDTIDLASVPEGYEVKVVAENTDRDCDSYGYSVLTDGYIVFSVSGPEGDNFETFKLPMSYSSYEGWEFNIDAIAPTAQKEKVVTTWEWV